MRTGLLGGSNAEEGEGSKTADDVGDSASADALEEDALVVVKEVVEDSRVALAVAVEESPEAS
jgi:hypothetical protein